MEMFLPKHFLLCFKNYKIAVTCKNGFLKIIYDNIKHALQ